MEPMREWVHPDPGSDTVNRSILHLSLALLMVGLALPAAQAAPPPADAQGVGLPLSEDAYSNCPPSGIERTLCQQTSCWYSGVLSKTFLCHGDPCYVGTTNVCVDPCAHPADPCDPDPCALPANPCGVDPCAVSVGSLIQDCTVNTDPLCDLGPLNDCSIQCFSNSPFECLGICNGGLGQLICYPDDPCDNTTLQRYFPGCGYARPTEPLGHAASTQAPALLA